LVAERLMKSDKDLIDLITEITKWLSSNKIKY
jgi:hypothetical protein